MDPKDLDFKMQKFWFLNIKEICVIDLQDFETQMVPLRETKDLTLKGQRIEFIGSKDFKVQKF